MRSIVTLNYIVYFTDKCPQEERSPAGSVTSSNRSSVRQKSTNAEINNTIQSINEIRHSLMDPSKRTNLSPTTG